MVVHMFLGKFKRREDGTDDELEDNWECQDEYLRVLFVQCVRCDENPENKSQDGDFRRTIVAHDTPRKNNIESRIISWTVQLAKNTKNQARQIFSGTGALASSL